MRSLPSHDPPDSTPPPGALRVRLSAVDRTALVRAAPARVVDRDGPQLTGPTVVASDGRRLVVVCAHHDGVVRVRAGSWPELREVATLDAEALGLAAPAAIVPFRGEWHLFARSSRGGSLHLVATRDLLTWRVDAVLSTDFAAFVVSHAVAGPSGLLLAGRVLVDKLAFGSALLEGDGTGFAARQVPVPVTSPLGVLGPVLDRSGAHVLLVPAEGRHVLARSVGRGWALTDLAPGITPTTLFDIDGEPWVAGYEPLARRVRLACPATNSVVELADPADDAPSVVSAAVRHGRHIVLVREA